MLTDATYSGRNVQKKIVVYYQLEVATVGGTEHHLVKQHKENNYGYVAWNPLCEWYDGGAVKNEAEVSLMYKFEIYCLKSDSNASQYMNDLLTSFQELKKFPGEVVLEIHALSLFLRGSRTRILILQRISKITKTIIPRYMI